MSLTNLRKNFDLKFGVEIEGFSTVPREKFAAEMREQGIDIVTEAWSRTSKTPNTWILTTDGSVSQKGYTESQKGLEIVSPPLIGSEGLSQLKNVLKVIRDENVFGSGIFRINKTASVHVHLSVEDLKSKEVEAIFLLYKKLEPELMKMMPPSRRSNRYCNSIQDISIKDYFSENFNRKYYSVNVNKSIPTIEFRAHGASTYFPKVCNWILILKEIYDYALHNSTKILKNKKLLDSVYLVDILPNALNNFYSKRVSKHEKKMTEKN